MRLLGSEKFHVYSVFSAIDAQDFQFSSEVVSLKANIVNGFEGIVSPRSGGNEDVVGVF